MMSLVWYFYWCLRLEERIFLPNEQMAEFDTFDFCNVKIFVQGFPSISFRGTGSQVIQCVTRPALCHLEGNMSASKSKII